MAMSGSAAGGDNQDMFSEGGREGKEERERQKAENRIEATAAAVRM